MRPLLSLLLLSSLVALSACKPASPVGSAAAAKPDVAPPPPLRVEVSTVEHAKMPRYLSLTGSVLAEKQSDVAANVSGRVAATYVERGQPVKAGDVLARVDARAAAFQAEAATAQSKAAEAQVSQATQDCERADALFGKGALPKSEYERQKTQCTAQLYGANAARATADLAGKLAGDTTIRSPIDGIVGERFVNVGEYVQPPSRVASVFAVDPVRVSISVPEPVVGQIHEGQLLEVQVSAYPDRRFPATIRFVSPALRPGTRDLIVEASAPNADRALRPGMFATVALVVGEDETPTVPESAVRSDGNIHRIFLAREQKAHELVVRTGTTKGGRIAVIESIAAGEQVVLSPPASLRDGAALQF